MNPTTKKKERNSIVVKLFCWFIFNRRIVCIIFKRTHETNEILSRSNSASRTFRLSQNGKNPIEFEGSESIGFKIVEKTLTVNYITSKRMRWLIGWTWSIVKFLRTNTHTHTHHLFWNAFETQNYAAFALKLMRVERGFWFICVPEYSMSFTEFSLLK